MHRYWDILSSISDIDSRTVDIGNYVSTQKGQDPNVHLPYSRALGSTTSDLKLACRRWSIETALIIFREKVRVSRRVKFRSGTVLQILSRTTPTPSTASQKHVTFTSNPDDYCDIYHALAPEPDQPYPPARTDFSTIDGTRRA
jgi:hypothetical protein